MFERKEQLKSGKSSWTDYKQRPATKDDKWCRRRAPWDDMGFIVTVPCQAKGRVNLGYIGGYIVRSKKIGGLLLLQVIPHEKKKPEYVVAFYENGLPTRARINIICETKGWRWPW